LFVKLQPRLEFFYFSVIDRAFRKTGVRKMKKGLLIKLLAFTFVVVLFGGSTFAMQQWLPFLNGEPEAAIVDMPAQVDPLLAITADVLLQQDNVNATEKPEEEPVLAEEGTEEDAVVSSENKVSKTQTNQQSNTAQNTTKKSNTNITQNKTQNSTGATVPPSNEQAPTPASAPEPTPTPTPTPTPAPEPEPEPEPTQPTPVVEEPKPTPSSPYGTLSSRTHRLLTRVVVTNKTEETSNKVRVEVPLISSSSVYQSRRSESFSIKPTEIKTVSGTRVGIFHLGDLEPGEEVVVEIKTEIRFSLIQFRADYVPTDTKKSSSYLNASSGIESTNSQIVNLSNQLTQGLTSDWDKAQAITRWVATNIKYDASAANRNSGALAALQTRKGVCEDYAMLAAALGRAAGIPARIAYGYADSNGTNWPSNKSFSLSNYRHAWVEFSLEGRGWVPAEPTRSTSSKILFGTVQHNRYFIQNYNNMSMKSGFSGGRPSISWSESLY
jgi:transglutaminase-like putative cysteine protease